MKKSLTTILLGTSLISNLLFNSCNYEKHQIENKQTSQEDTLLKIAGNYYYKGDYDLAKENYSKFLKIKKAKNDSLGIAKGFQGLGLIFKTQGNYDEAVKNNLNALNIYENLKDSLGIAQTSGNLGIIFDNQNKYVVSVYSYTTLFFYQTFSSFKFSLKGLNRSFKLFKI